jgi:3-oxoacid CoA-transferase
VNKVSASPADAIADIPAGATVGLGGFGQQHCFATSLLLALKAKGTRDLCVVCNSLGGNGELRGQILAENGQVSRLIASFTARPGVATAAEDQIVAGSLKAELVPQGILVERCRAGGAGIPAFYSPVGVGTAIEAGKEIRHFEGKRYVMEEAIALDYALLRAYRADRAGNVQMRGGSRSLNVAFAKSARIAIVEVDEIVEIGDIPAEDVSLPGIFVSRVVKCTHRHDVQGLSPPPRRPNDKPRLYKGRPGLTREAMACRAARIVREGSYVNLGIGIPTLVSNYLEGRDVFLHAENGILGYGRLVTGKDIDPDIYNAGGQFVATVSGASYFDSVTSFEMARGGHLSTVILGAYEVDGEGNIANWSTAQTVNSVGSIGGAMDLVAGGCELIAVMEHCDSKNRPKLRNKCSYPLTGIRCVNWVVTDLALLRWDGSGFVMEEVAPGFTPEEVVALGDMDITIAAGVKTLA